jgi:dihydrofolate synthase/folylpolyglutamate synthase
MTYLEVQSFLFNQLPMYQRQGVSAFKKNLDNIIALCELLENPQDKFRSIHVAGTNGKGSASHIIAAGLQANGYRVGLYTSPHYKDYRERIKINGEFISEEEVINFVEGHKNNFIRIQPSFFEITVAMAFAHFANQNVDIAIIETGLGGRLDSTNIINPLLSIITNISLDHQSMLGDTLEQIAGEKAGIIKSKTPVIIGEYQDEINHVFLSKKDETQSKIYQADLSSRIIQRDNGTYSFQINDNAWNVDFKTTMTNPYQLKNLVTALFSLWILKDQFQLDPVKIADGLENINRLTYYIGRSMIIQKEPLVIFDSAHNDAGISHLVEEITSRKYQKIHFVYGTAADKDLDIILSHLPKHAIYYFAKADIPRGMTTDALQKIASLNGLNGLEYPSVAAAYRNALSSANKDDIVVVAGSIFVVAEVL